MNTIATTAHALHGSGSNCAQSVVCAFADQVGFDCALAHRLSTCMGAGLGRKQLVCGAITGGAMVLGAVFGNSSGEDVEAKERAYAIVNEFISQLEAEFGSSDCATLLGVDLQTPTGRQEMKSRGLDESVCDAIIKRSVELVAEYIAKKA
ncbi:MAG: C_GCAxxG_C_C family protein [Spirochaetales bacterium]|nr:C_GCAxxG_C_C family protein [Spirochaetales bacterium]